MAVVFGDDTNAAVAVGRELGFNALGRVIRELSLSTDVVTETAVNAALKSAEPWCCFAGGAGRLRSIKKVERDRRRRRNANKGLN